MTRKNGRAPNFSLVNNRLFIAEIHLTFFAKEQDHAESTMIELTNLLAMAGYKDLHCKLLDPHDGHLVSEFLVKEGDGEEAPS